MGDERQWCSAWARFVALRKNVPKRIKQDQVNHYHSILEALEEASGENLSAFQIPENELKPHVTSFNYGTRRGPGRVNYSDDNYCDDTFFVVQIEGVFNYFGSLEQRKRDKPQMGQQTDYWSMSDSDLELLAIKYNIPPISRSGTHGENWYVDRDRIIDALLKRDNALNVEKAPPAHSNVINVGGHMYGSTIQQATERTSATIDYKSEETRLRELVRQICVSADELTLSPAARTQLEVDAQTIEVQLLSPHPKVSIVGESLHSMRNILEGIVGSVLASGLVLEISKFLGTQ